MKPILIILLLMGIIKPFDSFSQQNDATLDETISWIEGKLDIYSTELPASDMTVKFDKTTNKLIVYTNFLNSDYSVKQYTVKYVPVKNINPNNISIQQSGSTYFVNLYCNDDKRCIDAELWWADKGENSKSLASYSDISFKLPKDEIDKNPDLPERLKKAFIHLIKLCGGAGEKF